LSAICLFHVSDRETNISGEYDIGVSGMEFLYYEYRQGVATKNGFYMGRGNISDFSSSYTAFQWSSVVQNSISSFRISLSSPSSSLLYRRCVGNESSVKPIVLTAEPDRTPSQIPTPGETQPSGAPKSERGVNLTLLLAIGIPAVMLAAVAIVLVVRCVSKQQEVRNILTEQLDLLSGSGSAEREGQRTLQLADDREKF
jgi:hypothetical protein